MLTKLRDCMGHGSRSILRKRATKRTRAPTTENMNTISSISTANPNIHPASVHNSDDDGNEDSRLLREC
jgi:hypothetical protein